MNSAIKKKVVFSFKVLFSGIVLFYIIQKVDWDKVNSNLIRADYFLFLTAFALNFLERAELTLKWNILIKVKKVIVSFKNLFLINLIGAFLGMFLPSSLGTDIVRGYYLTKNDLDKSTSISSVFIDRLLGVLSLFFLGAIALFLAKDLIQFINPYFYLLGLFIPIIFIYYLQKEKTLNLFEKYSRKIKYKKISNALLKLQASFYDYKNYPFPLLYSLILSFLVQITRVLTYYIIALSFNIHFPFVYFLLFIPIIMLVIMLPISIGGLGLKEGTFIAFFSLVGMSVESATIISFTNTIVNTVITLFGGVAYIFYKPSQKSTL